jgi:hypothetical protein
MGHDPSAEAGLLPAARTHVGSFILTSLVILSFPSVQMRSALIVASVGIAEAAVAKDAVTSLPGFEGPLPSKREC